VLASTPHNRHRSARLVRLDAQKGYAGTPTIRNAQSLWFPFHSPAPWKRVSAALSVDRQSKSGVTFRRTRRRCFSVRLRRKGKAWEDRPGRVIRHPLHSWAPLSCLSCSDNGRLSTPWREVIFLSTGLNSICNPSSPALVTGRSWRSVESVTFQSRD